MTCSCIGDIRICWVSKTSGIVGFYKIKWNLIRDMYTNNFNPVFLVEDKDLNIQLCIIDNVILKFSYFVYLYWDKWCNMC